MIFDTHAHYDDVRYDEDREEVLSSLSAAGVRRVVNVSAGMDSVETSLKLAQSHDFVFTSLGVHPDETEALTESDMAHIRDLALRFGYRFAADPGNPGANKVVAIGEIGYEFGHEDSVPKEIQTKWFERMLELSNELDLPVIIHSRDAAELTYEMLKAVKTGDGAGIVHCFSYSKEMAKRFLDLGYYVALGGVVTFKNGRNAKEVAAYVPDDRLLIETDAPYLSPTPYRGTRNDSSRLPLIVAEIAALRGVSPERVEEMTWENANRLYRIKG